MTRGLIAGVDLGASNLRVVIANRDGEIQARRSMPTPGGAPEHVLDAIGKTVRQLAHSVWPGSAVEAAGIALPGTIDPDRGTAASVANLPGWDSIPIADLLGRHLGVPVAMDNDANAGAIGEGWLGAARGLRDYAFVALGTGIGCGIVLDGRLHRGRHFLAGEIAFFPMTREQLHDSGWDNCLEGIVGGRAYDRLAREILAAGSSAAQLFGAARDDPAVASAILAADEYLAMAIADIICLLDPEAIVFGGGVAAARGEPFLERIRGRALACTPARPRVLLTQLGEDAQVLGAVRLSLDKLERAQHAM